MTKQEMWKKVNTDNTIDFLSVLLERWREESQHEDINEYLQTIQKNITSEAFKIYKRPFGFDCKCDDGILNVSLKISGRYAQLIAKSKNI